MTDPLFSTLTDAGAARLERAIETGLPRVAPRALGWLRSLTATGRLADYFRHPSRFPMLAIPWWAGEGRPRDRGFAGDVIASTMAGYWYVRLIDDLVDRDPGAPVELLPLTALLHAEFHGGYLRHFPAESPFWETFRSSWLALADAMVARDGREPDNPAALLERATATIGAVLIPLRAVTLHGGFDDRYQPWRAVILELSRIEQLIDDVVDWHADYQRGLPNILIAEGRQRALAADAIPAWVVREGYRTGLAMARARIDGAAGAVQALGSGPLIEFLRRRREAVEALERETLRGLSQLAALGRAFESPPA